MTAALDSATAKSLRRFGVISLDLVELLAQLVPGDAHVVINLQADPEAFAHAQELRQAQARIRGDRPIAGENRADARYCGTSIAFASL